MAISKDVPYNLSPDGGTNFLTCPDAAGSATLAAPLPSYSNGAHSQIWTIKTTGTDLSSVQLKCTLHDGQEFYLVGNGEDNVLQVSQTEPTVTSWSISSSGQITWVNSGITITLYAQVSEGSPILAQTSLDWAFTAPLPTLAANQNYFLQNIAGDYLCANDTSGGNASTVNHSHGDDSGWTIVGTLDPSTGKIDNAQLLSESNMYLYGLHSQIDLQCFSEKNNDYYWNVQDNGDGTAGFECYHQVDSHVVGYMFSTSVGAPVTQVTKGTMGQKWKFTTKVKGSGNWIKPN